MEKDRAYWLERIAIALDKCPDEKLHDIDVLLTGVVLGAVSPEQAN